MNPHAQDPHNPAQNEQDGHAHDGNAPTLDDPGPRILGERPATIGSATETHSATGHTDSDPADEADPLEYTGVDPHEVRARLTRRGAVQGLELDSGTGVVWIPQWALPDLRRRLLLAQERFTALSGPVPGKHRRRPASAC